MGFAKSVAVFSAIALLGACSANSTGRSSWNVEAGALLDEGLFGNATLNNTLVQNGERPALVTWLNVLRAKCLPQ